MLKPVWGSADPIYSHLQLHIRQCHFCAPATYMYIKERRWVAFGHAALWPPLATPFTNLYTYWIFQAPCNKTSAWPYSKLVMKQRPVSSNYYEFQLKGYDEDELPLAISGHKRVTDFFHNRRPSNLSKAGVLTYKNIPQNANKSKVMGNQWLDSVNIFWTSKP